VAGLAKLHKYLNIEKLTKAQNVDVERAQTRQRIRSSDEIPFGAKAMLEDPDIEGVWNSRASTPLQSPILAPRSSSHSRLSLNPFSRSRRNSSVSSLSHLDLPQRSPSNASAEAISACPREPPGASSSALPAPSRNSQDMPWQYQVPMPYAQDQPMPRRRSVTIRATPREDVLAGRTTHGKHKSVLSGGIINATQANLSLWRPKFSRNEGIEYRRTLYQPHPPTIDVDER